MCSFPFLYLLLILLALLMVALITEGLKVCPVIEPVAADRPGLDVVHAGRGLDDALRLAAGAQRMLGPEGPAQSRPSERVVRVCRSLADVLAVIPFLRHLGVPWKFRHIVSCSVC